jgi:actin-like ATPase involved in cell morphogenesis
MVMQLLRNTVYVKVTKNQFWARHIEQQKEAIEIALEPFTTKRLLVGEFTTAEEYLRAALKKVHEGKWFSSSPVVIIHPMEMIDGGLSQIEERALIELATGAGARKVVVWVGHELSDQEVIENAKNV